MKKRFYHKMHFYLYKPLSQIHTFATACSILRSLTGSAQKFQYEKTVFTQECHTVHAFVVSERLLPSLEGDLQFSSRLLQRLHHRNPS